MKLVYIAGPFTVLNPFGKPDLPKIEMNVRSAEEVARKIIRHSDKFACLVPHSIGRYFAEGPGSPKYWYAATLEMANRCDYMVMVPGWEQSTGSKRERDRFIEMGRPVFTSPEALLTWEE